jgi:hypothetical protein
LKKPAQHDCHCTPLADESLHFSTTAYSFGPFARRFHPSFPIPKVGNHRTSQETKGLLNRFPNSSCRFRRGYPYPPMYTQFHPRSPNPPTNRQRVATAKLLTTRASRVLGWHPVFFKFCCKQKYFSHSTQACPLGDAWVNLASRLGDPRVTQSQTQAAEGRNSQTANRSGPGPAAARDVCGWTLTSCLRVGLFFCRVRDTFLTSIHTDPQCSSPATRDE